MMDLSFRRTLRRAACVLLVAFTLILRPLAPSSTHLAAAAGITTYTVTDLGTLGGPFSAAAAINNQGQIVGGSLNATPDPAFPEFVEFRAFLWEAGVMSDLGTLGGPDAGATSINNRGQVTGWSTFNSVINAGGLLTDAFLGNEGRLTNLGDLGNGSLGNGINDRGQVAGWSYNTTPDPANPGFPEQRAVLWDNGAMSDIGTLGGPDAEATAIDARGQITGSGMADLAGGGAFLWGRDTMRALGTLGVPCATGSAIDERGQIVGDVCTTIPDPSLPGATEDHPALWAGGSVQDLGLFPGDPDAQALAINNQGQIVGQSGDQSGPFRAVLWQDGVVIDLNVLIPAGSGWQLIAANGINDRGQIVGAGVNMSGDVHGLLLTPADGHGPAAVAVSAATMNSRAQAALARLPANARASLLWHRFGRVKTTYRP